MITMPLRKSSAAVFVVVAALVSTAHGSTDDHRYKDGEHVELWVNKVSLNTSRYHYYYYHR